MIQASWGPIAWMISSEELRALSEISASVELDLDSGDDKEGSSATNNKGLKSQTLSLSFPTSYLIGTDTRAEYETWVNLIGQYAPFYLGGKRFGPEQMQLTKVDVSGSLTGNGKLSHGEISIVLTEYGNEPSELKPTPAESIDTEALGLKLQKRRKSAAELGASSRFKERKAGSVLDA